MTISCVVPSQKISTISSSPLIYSASDPGHLSNSIYLSISSNDNISQNTNSRHFTLMASNYFTIVDKFIFNPFTQCYDQHNCHFIHNTSCVSARKLHLNIMSQTHISSTTYLNLPLKNLATMAACII